MNVTVGLTQLTRAASGDAALASAVAATLKLTEAVD